MAQDKISAGTLLAAETMAASITDNDKYLNLQAPSLAAIHVVAPSAAHLGTVKVQVRASKNDDWHTRWYLDVVASAALDKWVDLSGCGGMECRVIYDRVSGTGALTVRAAAKVGGGATDKALIPDNTQAPTVLAVSDTSAEIGTGLRPGVYRLYSPVDIAYRQGATGQTSVYATDRKIPAGKCRYTKVKSTAVDGFIAAIRDATSGNLDIEWIEDLED